MESALTVVEVAVVETCMEETREYQVDTQCVLVLTLTSHSTAIELPATTSASSHRLESTATVRESLPPVVEVIPSAEV